MMTMLRADQTQPRLFACALAVFLCMTGTGCQKESEAIVSIALHPTNANILYVATNDAVYKSRDEGQLWERFPSFSARRVTTLAIDPQFPATIYAGTLIDRDEQRHHLLIGDFTLEPTSYVPARLATHAIRSVVAWPFPHNSFLWNWFPAWQSKNSLPNAAHK